jgi:hypothetical protein
MECENAIGHRKIILSGRFRRFTVDLKLLSCPAQSVQRILDELHEEI